MHDRMSRLQQRVQDLELDGVLLGPGANLRWATGLDAHASERLTMLVVPAQGSSILVVPRLEAPLAAAADLAGDVTITPWDETDDPLARVADLLVGADGLAVDDRLWTQFTLGLQSRLPDVTWSPASSVTEVLRLVKDPAEIDALRAAGAAIDRVHDEVGTVLAVGRTELEVAADLERLIRATHDTFLFCIVASGPNGASPHHANGHRRLAAGDAVVVDIGGTLDGYASDETRNYAIGHACDDYREAHGLLERAQAAARRAVRPDVTAGSIDLAARDVIRHGGHGPHFVHRTGHGIGLDGHEPPWIVAGNDQLLQVGMAFSVEPGIYVPDRHGARIEDIVVVTRDGHESLNHRPRALQIV